MSKHCATSKLWFIAWLTWESFLHSHSLIHSTESWAKIKYNHLVTRKSGNKHIMIYINLMSIKIILDICLHILLSVCWISHPDVPWKILIHSSMNFPLPMSKIYHSSFAFLLGSLLFTLLFCAFGCTYLDLHSHTPTPSQASGLLWEWGFQHSNIFTASVYLNSSMASR